MPSRLYQTPSRVRQTSSASILPPVVNRITGRPPWRLPMPGPLVETGALVVLECEVASRSGELFGVASGEGDGEAISAGEGDDDCDGGSGVTSGFAGGFAAGSAHTPSGDWISAVFCARRLKL